MSEYVCQPVLPEGSRADCGQDTDGRNIVIRSPEGLQITADPG